MEAPEKIYLSQERDKDGCYVDLMWHKHPYENMKNIQYICKDAFIEKALKFLDEKFFFDRSRYSIESGEFDSKEEMIEDFKKSIWRNKVWIIK